MFNGIRKQEIILRHISAACADGLNGHVIHVMTVDKYCAVGHVVDTQQQIH